MRRSQKILINSSVGIGQNIFNILVSVFVNGYIANKLGVQDYGKFVFAYSFTALFSVLADFGLQGFYSKKIAAAKSKTGSYLGDMIVVRSVLSVFAVVTTLLVVSFTDQALDTKMAVGVACVGVLLSGPLFTTAWTVFNAHEKMKYVAYSNVISRIVVAAFAVIVLQYGGGMLHIAIVYATGYGVQVIYCGFVIWKYFVPPKFAISLSKSWKILRAALPYSLFSIFYVLFLQIDKTMLSLISGDEAVGIYNAASVLCINSSVVSSAISTAAFPSLVQYYREERKEEFDRRMQVLLKWMLILGLPIALAGMTYAKDIILFIYRSESYLPSVLILQMMIWMVPVDFMSRVIRHGLIASDREKVVTWTCGVGLAVNVVLNFVLIPPYSYVGAVVSTLVSQTVFMVIQFYFLLRKVKVAGEIPWMRLLAGNGGLFLGLFVMAIHLNWVIGIILAVVLYFGQMVLLKVIMPYEVGFIIQRLSKKVTPPECRTNLSQN